MAINWFKKKNTQSRQEAPSPQTGAPESDPQFQEDKSGQHSAQQAPDEQTIGAAAQPPSAPPPAQASPPNAPTAPKGLFARLKQGLAKTRHILTTDIEDLFGERTQIDDELLEQLEELLITSDIGVQPAMQLIRSIERQASTLEGPEALKEALRREIHALLDNVSPSPPQARHAKPHVVMVVGVNGVGKTTTIGKLAARNTQQGKSVLIAAADTFRAAAIEQLTIWAERAGADIVKHKENTDPAAVAYDSVEAALARGIDNVYVDTAGRLHTKVNLMQELKKIKRSIAKRMPDAPHEILLVLDATTGQNALSQTQLFHEAIGVTGLALTKLDGTAKGGIVIRICQSLKIPLHYIGVGESIEDLQPFDPRQFVDALF